MAPAALPGWKGSDLLPQDATNQHPWGLSAEAQRAVSRTARPSHPSAKVGLVTHWSPSPSFPSSLHEGSQIGHVPNPR